MSEATAAEIPAAAAAEAAVPVAAPAEAERGVKRTVTGVVTSDKANKTITVQVTRRVRHPVYGKEMKVSKKYHAHDEKNEAKTGDTVRIVESRPLSKLKRWRLIEIVAKAKAAA